MEKDPIKNIELIEAWYEGRLDASGMQHVNDLLESDPEFKEEFDLYHTLVVGIKNVQFGSIKNQLKKIDEELDRVLPENSVSINNKKILGIPLAIAASVIVLLVAGVTWIYLSKNSKEALFARYYIEDPGLPVFMSNSSSKDFDEAMNHYKLQEYNESLMALRELLDTDPDNDTLLYYSGVNLLKLKKSDAALDYFKNVYLLHDSEFKQAAHYRYIICLWLTGNIKAMEVELNLFNQSEAGSDYWESLNKIMRKN